MLTDVMRRAEATLTYSIGSWLLIKLIRPMHFHFLLKISRTFLANINYHN